MEASSSRIGGRSQNTAVKNGVHTLHFSPLPSGSLPQHRSHGGQHKNMATSDLWKHSTGTIFCLGHGNEHVYSSLGNLPSNANHLFSLPSVATTTSAYNVARGLHAGDEDNHSHEYQRRRGNLELVVISLHLLQRPTTLDVTQHCLSLACP